MLPTTIGSNLRYALGKKKYVYVLYLCQAVGSDEPVVYRWNGRERERDMELACGQDNDTGLQVFFNSLLYIFILFYHEQQYKQCELEISDK